MPSDLYKTVCSRKIFASFDIYHVSFEEKYIILLYRYKFDVNKIPPNPNTTIGSHTFMYSKAKNSIIVISNNDGKVNMNGNVLKMSDDKLGDHIKVIRFTHEFPRLGGLFTSKDVWLLKGIQVPYNKLKEVAKKNNLDLKDIKDMHESWLTKDVLKIIMANSSVNCENYDKVYNNLAGSLVV